jgi:hypothetical protein
MALSNFGAAVRGYNREGLVDAFVVPPNRAGNRWNVCKIVNGIPVIGEKKYGDYRRKWCDSGNAGRMRNEPIEIESVCRRASGL